LYDPEEAVVITESANQILGDLKNKTMAENVTLPTDVELVLEIISRGTEKICGYYFVEHSSRCLFWLEEFDAEQICDEIKVVVSLSHLRTSVSVPKCILCLLIPIGRVRDRISVLVGAEILKVL
jgi:hypothetical protein